MSIHTIEINYDQNVSVNTVFVEQSQTGRQSAFKEMIKDSRIYEAGLEIIFQVSKVLKLDKMEHIAHEGNLFTKFVKAWNWVKEGKLSLNPKSYFEGTKEDADNFVESGASIVHFSASGINFVCKVVSSSGLSTHLQASSEFCEKFVLPFLENTIGKPIKILKDYSEYQATQEMGESTVEEKQLKSLSGFKSKASLAINVAKLGLEIARPVFPVLESNPVIGTPLAISSVAVTLVEVYLIYKETQKSHRESSLAEEMV